jgi:hypothetical protein
MGIVTGAYTGRPDTKPTPVDCRAAARMAHELLISNDAAHEECDSVSKTWIIRCLDLSQLTKATADSSAKHFQLQMNIS